MDDTAAAGSSAGGRCLRVQARPAEALPFLERALAASPDQELQMLIYSQIGLSEQYLLNDQRAERAFRDAFELNRRLAHRLPDPAFAFYKFLSASNKERDSAAVLDEILRWSPGFLPARLQRARRLMEAGRLKEAVDEAEFVVRNTDPADKAFLRAGHILLLQLCTKLGRTEDARRHHAWLKDAQAGKQP